jgi:hypothetical protein
LLKLVTEVRVLIWIEDSVLGLCVAREDERFVIPPFNRSIACAEGPGNPAVRVEPSGELSRVVVVAVFHVYRAISAFVMTVRVKNLA